MKVAFGFLLLLLCAGRAYSNEALFAKPGRMIPVGRGSRLSLYCVGTGQPTILLESGFGGGTAATWMRLQPLLAKVTRTCSYDRAGYGFSELGANLPRDLNRAVADLSILLRRSGEKAPYIFLGHSNGGLMIGAFADLHPESVAGLVFLDAAVALPGDVPERETTLDDSLRARLDRIRQCLERAERKLVPVAGDGCVNPNWYALLSPELAAAEVANRSKADYWRAYLSEAENNYSSRLSAQAQALLPHRWLQTPVRVFIASVSQMNDESAARSFGIDVNAREALAKARSNRANGELRQERICEGVADCKVVRVPTANHLVHNEVLPEVTDSVRELVVRTRSRVSMR